MDFLSNKLGCQLVFQRDDEGNYIISNKDTAAYVAMIHGGGIVDMQTTKQVDISELQSMEDAEEKEKRGKRDRAENEEIVKTRCPHEHETTCGFCDEKAREVEVFCRPQYFVHGFGKLGKRQCLWLQKEFGESREKCKEKDHLEWFITNCGW